MCGGGGGGGGAHTLLKHIPAARFDSLCHLSDLLVTFKVVINYV